MDHATCLCILGLSGIAAVQGIRIHLLVDRADGHERRVRVLEGLLDARGLLPGDVRPVEPGVATLTLVHPEEGY